MDEHLLEVYLINTARHTEETPVAEWVSLPTDAETMKAVFERLGVDGSDTEQYQVSAFHSSLDGWSEALKPGESLDDLNYLAALLTQRSDEENLQAAQAQDLRISFVSQYYVAAQNRRPHVLVMNYSGLEEEKVEEAVSRLCRAVLG